jgi:hypothetical protein|tara:strand:- start:1730 stop:1966 length:237 start_codon:yes stop_codon:yes gene_type:complete
MTNSEPQPEHSFNDLLAGLLANKPLRAAFFSDHLLPVEDFREKHLPVVTAWAEETGKAIDRATAARLARRVWMALYFE